MPESTVVLPAVHPALHLWIESETVDVGTDPGAPSWTVDYLHVGLTNEVLEWCDAFLSARPKVVPGRYPNDEYPDCAAITKPLYHMLPQDGARVQFASDRDAVHFRLAWY